jgi:prevent-host-death family protein
MSIPQIMPISTMQRNYSAVVRQLPDGPVFLSQHSKPIAVMLSTSDYETMSDELKRLRRIIQGDQELAAIRAGNFTELPMVASA